MSSLTCQTKRNQLALYSKSTHEEVPYWSHPFLHWGWLSMQNSILLGSAPHFVGGWGSYRVVKSFVSLSLVLKPCFFREGHTDKCTYLIFLYILDFCKWYSSHQPEHWYSTCISSLSTICLMQQSRVRVFIINLEECSFTCKQIAYYHKLETAYHEYLWLLMTCASQKEDNSIIPSYKQIFIPSGKINFLIIL